MEIISPNNARVKEWAQLLEKKHRTRQHKYIVEGIHLVQEALRSNAVVESVAYDLDKGIPAELNDLDQADRPVEWVPVSAAVIAKCTDTKTPQSVFAIVRKEERGAFPALLEQPDALVMVLDGVQDPGNVGTIIRSADAAGAAGVILGHGCADLYNPKTIRSTMGSLFHLPVIEGSLEELLPQAKSKGARLISTSLDASLSCYAVDLRVSAWLVIGNEGQGISASTARMVDESVFIPMQGQAESLNAAMASTVLLFEAMRQRS
ncbi:tRNA/rRNA methyltransferase (spou) [Paenibacillus terrae HPL-003]|uniref:tRNA/rRNA methyltransferase (Spou) n=1 Tax=Paenibacillus terrae (strain HPL-003) TaxID=985665 RepID=G7VY07_PAETH|nr:RNA methyltransferase [Paenibacillus terrae]AET57185.1 tRNA/rRNA methyltransferase (spou) [Paenibacillus terrae HPL-003]